MKSKTDKQQVLMAKRHNSKDPLMTENEALSKIEQQKIDLVKMRIKNNYYDRDEVLKQVVSQIVHHEIGRKS